MKMSRKAAATGVLTLALFTACGEDGPSSTAEGHGDAGGEESEVSADGNEPAGPNGTDEPGPSDDNGGAGPGPNVPASTPDNGVGGTTPAPSSNGGETNVAGSGGNSTANQGGGESDSGGSSGGTGAVGGGGNAAGGTDSNGGASNGGTGGTPPEVCVHEAPCVPADPCHQGWLDCSGLEPLCVDAATAAADGTPCGEDQVCRTGLCQSCVEGQSCTPDDPCALGETSCALGIEECVPVAGGMDMGTQCAGEFTAADATDDGFCSSEGVCECPAGTSYFQGQCAPCPEFPLGLMYVNAEPEIGLDNHCCGRSMNAGFGGPCRTVSAALQADDVLGKNIQVTATATGDLSPAEVYPWRPDATGAYIMAAGPTPVCVPGVAGQPVVVLESGLVTLDALRIGATCQGVSSGASVGLQIGPGAEDNSPRIILNATYVDGPDVGVLILNNGVLENAYTPSIGAETVFIRNTQEVGIQINGGTLFGFFNVENPGSIGVLCQSEDAAWPSNFGLPSGDQTGVSVFGATEYDVFASMNCRTPRPISMVLGQGPCSDAPRDRYGLYAEGDAQVALREATFQCFEEDAISLRNNLELSVNAPQVEASNGFLYGALCAGAYAEVGFLRIHDTRFVGNHWGAVQRSNQSGTPSVLNVSGQFEATDSPNEFYCNGQIAAPSCDGPGGDVWNNSGLDLDASFNDWPEFPLSQCNCNEALASCSCVGSAFGQTTPPAGVSALGSPFQGSVTGSINVSDAAARVASECPL